ncbi:hypothetical protein DSO57_1035880 [Entomophthora muscae]|uniref:Uncharacterized protein n=1 Tax=Entomophthora muscae TaxID=34485 RepID=A0ACC2S1B6_9FUNG|nr:hypothetical protein DSO57_1035880 [Entomophthora muscae]
MSKITSNTPTIERILAACRTGSIEQLQEAINEGSFDINGTDAVGNTALNLSVKSESLDCVNLLLKQEGLDLDIANKLEGNSPLHTAILNIRNMKLLEAITQALLEHGANPKATNKEGLTALDYACHGGSSYVEISDLLRNAIAALNMVYCIHCFKLMFLRDGRRRGQ